MKIRPFREGDTSATFTTLIENTVAEIDALDNEYVLKASPAELEAYYLDKVTFQPIELSSECYIEDKQGTRIDVTHDFNRGMFPGGRAFVQGTQLDIAVPFNGDPLLWRLRASTYSLSGYPEIEVRNGSILFNCAFPDDSADPQRIKTDIEEQVQSLSDAVRYLKNDVDSHNNSAPARIKSALERKRSIASAALDAVAALGIPIKRRDDPPTFIVPTKRRHVPTEPPAVSTEKYEPEPTLAEEEYQHILRVLKSMSLVIERNPDQFASLDEETIRTHFLLQLNGHYEGSATGETFNASGKTDILIRVGNRNIFIAECKFWRGPKEFGEAVDQLLAYLSWRDSKCALLIYNKTLDSTAVRKKMHQTMISRPQYRKTVSNDPHGDSRYTFVKESDPGREIIITTQLFDLPTTKS